MNEPWYRSPTQTFTLRKKFSLNSSNRLRSLALFPWKPTSSLWHGLDVTIGLDSWNSMIAEHTGLLAAGCDHSVYIISTTRKDVSPIKIEIPDHKGRTVPTDRIHVAWALSPEKAYNPLLLISSDKLLFIYDVRSKQICGCLRGHGGAITSINVHPIHPHVFCTTSRDFSTRVYRLSDRPKERPVNPRWPTGHSSDTRANLAGPAHGLDMSDGEGWGIGRCVVVLAGGLSGGHHAEVLGAAFHLNFPLLATCGMDRAVKIWYIPSSEHLPLSEKDKLVREDKPLFSTTLIHRARVLSVNWLSDDTLLTHSAPAILRGDDDNTSSIVSEVNFDSSRDELESGTIMLWRWLGLDRFFPPGWEPQTRFSGCSSDYQDSNSFKIIASYWLPAANTQYDTVSMDVTLDTLDPLILYTTPASTTITMKNVTHFKPRPLPPEAVDHQVLVRSNRARLLEDPEDPHGWKIVLDDSYKAPGEIVETSIACMNGAVVIAGGSKGTIWIWVPR